MSFEMDVIRLILSASGDGILRERAWLQESLTNPMAFARALFQDAVSHSECPRKSQLGLAYDFYHDAVGRMATGPSSSRAAMQWPATDPAAPPETISYAHLHAAVCLLSAAWRKRGTKPGDILCIIYPMGPELLLALCTGLKLGLVVCVLPPLGADFLSNRLRALQPAHIVTAKRYHTLLRDWYGDISVPIADTVLDDPLLQPRSAAATIAAVQEASASPLNLHSSHSYGPTDAVLCLCSPQRESAWIPLPVSASAVYLGALCDGLLLGVGHRGSVVAAPEIHPLQYHPTLLLLVLLHGGTYLDIQATHLSGEYLPQVRLPGVDVLLISAAVRDILLSRRARPLREVQSWVCALTESASSLQWKDWVTQCQLGDVPAACVHYDAACGGCLMFSLRGRGMPPLLVYPSPARPFALSDPQAETMAARGSHGILRPLPGSCGLLLIEHAGGYVYGGTRWPSRSGLSLSAAEVEQVIGDLPYVAGAAVVPTPSDSGQATLLVFLGPHMREAPHTQLMQIEHAVRDRIRNRLGLEFEPRTVQLVATLPRRNDSGKIDPGWCADQQREGKLAQRAQDPVLSVVDKLLFACHRLSTPAGQLTLRAQNRKH